MTTRKEPVTEKFFLEHGLEPNLVVDHAPDAIVPSWA